MTRIPNEEKVELLLNYKKFKTLEDCLFAINETDDSFNSRTIYDNKKEKGYKKLQVIQKALGLGLGFLLDGVYDDIKDWQLNWNDKYQQKYFPCFENMTTYHRVVGCSSCTDVIRESVAYFATYDIALYAGKTFKKIYNEYLIPIN